MTEILSIGEIERWLLQRPVESSIQIALRNALRVMPLAHHAAARHDSNTAMATLACMRACLVSNVAISDRDSEIQGAAFDAHHFARANMSDRFGSPAVEAAAIAAFTAYASDGYAKEAASGLRVFTNHNSRRLRARPLQEPLEELSDVPAFFASADIGKLKRNEKLREVVLPKEVSNFVDGWATYHNNILAAGGPWSFWSRWYDRTMAGDPLPWDLQHAVALIPDAIWEQGPDAVAERIAEIEARFEVRERLRDLSPETDLQLVTSRHGIGGNGPPEPIDTPPEVQQSVTIIWAEIATIAEEVENETPDKSRIEAALKALKVAFGVCLRWIGRKLDLTVNTAVGVGVTAALAGSEKLHAVIQAVEKWLALLP